MTLRFGLSLPQGAAAEFAKFHDPVEAYEAMVRVAQTAEEVGFDAVWLTELLWTEPSQDFFFECWTTTAALARETKRVRIGQTVTTNGLRNPALLAKMASTVDVMSHGRLRLGIGSGAAGIGPQFRAYGYDYPDTAIRQGQLGEAVQILLSMWTQEEATFEGKYYQVHGAINQPKGVQRPHIPLLIGGGGEQITLKLVAHYGDACNVGGDPATITHKFAVLRQHCEAIGRDYESIQRTISTMCCIAETDEQARAKLPPALLAMSDAFSSEQRQAFEGMMKHSLIGSPDTIRQRLAALEDAGVQEVRLTFLQDLPDLEALRFFARELIA
ncbi:MAG TPA: TIGR03560 family F420-dependent LLM class oxidoreductase [Ktedonobacteraceae bacterium]|jgi:F420-dependent oxidoreductase-like protein|nr:TIGR03560 family F420-dependent LLM class oxidoreductase [Ktedonobacteraceae bacterium]